jgi:hypothetical protein
MAAITKNRNFFKWSKLLCTFWLKIEQFWPFEEISIFSNGGHLGYRTALTDTIFMNFELLPILTDYEIKKRGDEIKKKSSPLKLLSQFQPNFAEMILRWSPFKIVSVSAVLHSRGEDFFLISSPLFFYFIIGQNR